MAGQISDLQSDAIFLAMMRLFNLGKTTPELRKRIIKGIRAPISEPALVFLGKRLRDQNDDVCSLIYRHLTQNEVTLENFMNDEMRMLVLAEGLQSQNDTVREQCVEFLSKSVLTHQDDLSYLLTLVNCKLAFTN